MGYQSDVGLCLTANGKKALDIKLAELEPGSDKERQVHELLNLCDKKLEDPKSGAVAWFWEFIKWYCGYNDVDFIEDLLNELDDSDYYFIRVGESDDDTEVRGDFWDNPFSMYLSRGIAVDC